LARADIHDVLRHWEGLGYYRRARDLHRAARMLLADHGGAIPDNPDVLILLPGLGRYTVGAVLSQAFDRRLPILETNSVRVLCRLIGARQDPKKEPLRGALWHLAAEVLPVKRVGHFNQALMELGALVCTPTNPQCQACPLRGQCRAHSQNLQADIPLKGKKAVPVTVKEVAVVVRRGRRILLAQRPSEGRWGGLWEFPRTAVDHGETEREAAKRLLKAMGIKAELGGEIMVIQHAVTRFRIRLTCLEALYCKGRLKLTSYKGREWLSPNRLGEFPICSPQRKLARIVESHLKPTRSEGSLAYASG